MVAFLLAVASLAVVAVMGWHTFRPNPAETTTCTVSAAGAIYRAHTDVGTEHLPRGKAGDRYQSDSGCLPIDVSP